MTRCRSLHLLIFLLVHLPSAWGQEVPLAPPKAPQRPVEAPLPFGAPLLTPPPQPPAPSLAGLATGGPDPRRVLYPPTPPFPHRRHQGQACLTCHSAVVLSTRAGDVSVDWRCGGCHPSADRGPSPRPSPQIKFDHSAHQRSGVGCDRCHGGIMGGERPAGVGADFLPDMDLCLTCHTLPSAGSLVKACAQCHLTDPGGRVMTALPTGQLSPMGRQGFGDHRGDFAAHHGPEALASPQKCQTCHSPDRCQTCHAGGIRPVSQHPADYLMHHGPDARRNDPDCGQCHRAAIDCLGCHQQAGLGGPGAGPLAYGADGRQRGGFHRPGFVGQPGGIPGPDHHSHEARRNLDTCVSCHTEDTCLRCHSAAAPAGLRASPHRGDPRGLCRGGRSVAGCQRCHLDLRRICP